MMKHLMKPFISNYFYWSLDLGRTNSDLQIKSVVIDRTAKPFPTGPKTFAKNSNSIT